MCGIFASYVTSPIISKTAASSRAALGCLSHRGPDANSEFLSESGRAFIGHSLLSVSNPSPFEGIQPVTNERGSLAFNGELYNVEDLKDKLKTAQAPITQESEAAILLAGIQCFGWSFLGEIQGCWAIVLYDKKTDSIFFGRDRLGEKQLKYSAKSDKIFISSEEKALIHVLGSPGFNEERIISDLIFDFFSNRDRTYFEAIRNCLPGAIYEVKPPSTVPTIIYQCGLSSALINAPLRTKLSKAISSMLPNHHRFAIVLSGGLDSGIIASLLKTECQDIEFTAITATYEGKSDGDIPYAKMLTRHLGKIDHHILDLKPQDLIDSFDEVQLHLQEPFQDQVYLAQYQIYKKLAELGFRVAFNGQGADEFWGGYFNHYQLAKLNSLGLGGLEAHFLSVAKERGLGELLSAREIIELIHENIESRWCGLPALDSLLIEGHLQAMLSHEDKLSMANGVELRLPFLNHALVQHAMALPFEDLVSGGLEKSPLRTATNGLLIDEVRLRRKSPFPDAPKSSYISSKLLREKTTAKRFFSESEISRIKAVSPSIEWRLCCINVFANARRG